MGSADGQASKKAVQSDEQACMHWKDLRSKTDTPQQPNSCTAVLPAQQGLKAKDSLSSVSDLHVVDGYIGGCSPS